MTREDLFRAVGEVREDQIEAAGSAAKQARPWRRFGALAACLALVVTAAAAAPWIQEQRGWKAIVYSFQPNVEVEDAGSSEDAGGGAETGGLDGERYWTEDGTAPAPRYSTGVEIGELSGPGNGSGMAAMSDVVWLSPEEVFAQDTLIFRGTVRELQYYKVEMGSFKAGIYYTKALVEITDSIRGGLEEGTVCSLGYMGAKGYMTTSLSGPLEDLEAGSDAIFMPIRTSQETGRQEGNAWFCYADLAELYIGEGMRYVFADTGDGLDFDGSTYPALEAAETLDEVAAYIRTMTAEEGTQPAAIPAVPQAEPSKTAEAGDLPKGPAGARELPGGAYVGEGTPGVSP